MKFKKGDSVIVISGKDKGKKGKIVRVIRESGRVVVDGLNIKKKHQRARKGGQKGQIIEIPFPMHASNVMIEDPKTGKPSRIGISREGGKRLRISKKSGTAL
ncbi:50S ribosomal protein L24 [bacterium]|nr:50S ribosomal protein L24 [bacterium]MCI0566037.1 50S ribosomal protein L24 [bacterium]